MKVTFNPNTTIVDAAFNLTGSLAGIPVILNQLPVGDRVGFATLPSVATDTTALGQTWTPNLDGMTVDLSVSTLNPEAQRKAPYTSPVYFLQKAIDWGENFLRTNYDND